MIDHPVTPEAQAQALDALLNYQAPAAGPLDPKDAALAGQIRDLADNGLPADLHFYLQLEEKLKAEAKRRQPHRAWGWPRWFAGLAAAAVLILLVVFSIPLLQHILGQPASGQPAPAATLPAVGPAGLPTRTQPAALRPTLPAALTPLAATETLAANSGWQIKAALPEGPQEIKAFQMASPGEPVTPDSALAMAAKLGIQGTLRQYTGEGGGVTYHVSDGKSWVIFFGQTTREFTYSSGYHASSTPQTPPSFEHMSKAAVEWLQSRGLLDFAYQVQPALTNPFAVAIVQQVDGANLYQQNVYDPPIRVEFDADGQVQIVLCRPVLVTEAGATPIRSAANAWAMLQSGQLEKGVFYQTLNFDQQRSLRSWYRAYTPGEKADIYGYASIIQAANPADAPYAEVAFIPLAGDVRVFASQVGMRQALHVWGIYQRDEQGRGWLELQGWENFAGEAANLNGTLERRDGVVWFKDEQNQVFTLQGVPEDVPQNEPLSLSGVRLGDSFAWWIIQSHVGTENNQSIGALPIPGQPLGNDTVPPAAPLPETGYQPDEKVEALQGNLHAVIYQKLDGSQKLVNQMDVTSNGQFWTAQLTGPGAQGIEAYDHLPVKVWGTYGVVNNEIVLTVERYEPVWPGVTIQAYFGKVNEQTLSGQTVMTVTGDDGQRWVLKMSLSHFQSLESMGWAPGTEVVVEGYLPPDETFGGLPVLQELSLALLGHKGTTRETYKMQNAHPRVEQAPLEETALPGNAMVDQVALVYAYEDSHGGPQVDHSGIPLVPLWRFSGTLADGRAFEVLVPAEKH